MKRIFTNLKAYASVAMAIAVMGVAALGVSCKYDDTAIYDEIEGVKGDLDGVKGDLAELEERVAKLETKVNTEVAALQALVVTAKTEILDEVDDKFAVVNGTVEEIEAALAEKYAELAAKDKELADQLATMEAAIGKVITAQQKATGEWVLTLSDGKEITVYPQFKQDYKGMVTVKEENGVYYWAQYNENGVVNFLKDAEGNKYPLHHATPVVDMDVINGNVNDAVTEAMKDIQLRVNEEGVTEMTLDGGLTWTPLAGGDAGMFTEVSQDLAAGTATFTLVGGEEITVALAKEEEPEMLFAIKSGKLHFANDQVQEIKLAAELVAEVFVLSQPAGWEVEYNGKNLVVTAPSYEDVVDTETAAEEGWIKVLATGTDKGAVVAKVKVTVSELGLFIQLLGDGTFNIHNTMTVQEYGETYAMPYYYGIVPAEGFSIDWLANAVENYEVQPMQEMLADFEEPVDLNYLYGSLNGYFDMDLMQWVEPQMEMGESYIVWAAAQNFTTYMPDWDNLTYVEFKNAVAKAEVVKTYFNDVDVNVVMGGYNGYYLNLYKSQYAESVAGDLAQAVMYAQYGFRFGIYCDNEGFEGSLVEAMDQEVLPNTAYTLYILPWDAAADPTEITVDDLLKVEFTTTALSAGGEGVPTFAVNEEKTNYTTVAGKLTPAEGTVLTYYKWYTEEEMAAFADDAAIVENLLAGLSDWMNPTLMIDKATDVQRNQLKQGTTMYLAAISIDADGKYGQLLKTSITTKQVTYSDVVLTLSDGQKSADGLSYSFKLTGDMSKVYYEWADNSSNYARWKGTYKGSVDEASLFMATNSSNTYYIKEAPAANEHGFITLNLPAFNKDYVLVVGGLDANGAPVKAIAVEVDTTFEANVIKQYLDDGVTINPDWEASKPIVNVTAQPDPENPNLTDVKISVTPGAGAVKCWMNKFYVYGTQLASAKVSNMLSSWINGGYETMEVAGVYGAGVFTDEVELTYTMSKGYHIHILWVDADGNYYEPYCYQLPTEEGDEPELA